jgi:hypothetical protein
VDDGCPAIGSALQLEAIANNLGWVSHEGGGTAASLDCGDRMMRFVRLWTGGVVDKITASCARPKLGTPYFSEGRTEYSYPIVMGDLEPLVAEYGGNGADHNPSDLDCTARGSNAALAGVFGRATDQVDQLGAICWNMAVERVDGAWRVVTWSAGDVGPAGGGGGDPFSLACPSGTLLHRFDLRTTHVVANLSAECARYRVPVTDDAN